MTRIPDTSSSLDHLHPPRAVTAKELGDEVAHQVWESFSDFLEDEAHDLHCALEIPIPEEGPDRRLAEEMLIFLMWAHTRGIQQAFVGRVSQDVIREALDALHEAVFDDLVKNGTPRSQLPFFEQRVGARYTAYSDAARASDDEVGIAALRYMGARDKPHDLAWSFVERALSIANPLRDYLEDVELVS